MTVIVVRHPAQRISVEQRRVLAQSLTDAVLEVECGVITTAARYGFQVHFQELALDQIAIGGRLLTDQPMDAMVVDIAVMDGAWPPSSRATAIKNVLAALRDALDVNEPSANWWVNFRVIDEGSWGAGANVISMLDLLAPGIFTDDRIAEIRAALPSRP
jgi:phenylpyruvate tautomerase PptA (4-oxalocrotonate tautomerase family)